MNVTCGLAVCGFGGRVEALGLGLFPRVSMLNHACAGTRACNVDHAFDLSGCPLAGELSSSGAPLASASTQAPGQPLVGGGEAARGRPALVVRAARRIAAGEECCYSYVPHGLPFGERARLLKQGYGFDLAPEPEA